MTAPRAVAFRCLSHRRVVPNSRSKLLGARFIYIYISLSMNVDKEDTYLQCVLNLMLSSDTCSFLIIVHWLPFDHTRTLSYQNWGNWSNLVLGLGKMMTYHLHKPTTVICNGLMLERSCLNIWWYILMYQYTELWLVIICWFAVWDGR